jgi:hypothetical protein
MVTNDFETDVMKWREERAERLRTSEKSWLGLAGLFWLKEGNNTFGSDPGCNFVLPPTAPKKAGVFNFKNDLVTEIRRKAPDFRHGDIRRKGLRHTAISRIIRTCIL